MGKTYLHVVWSAQLGPMYGYTNPELAHAHARTMLGADVGTVEILTRLHEAARDDLSIEFEGENDTPLEDEREDIAMEITAAVPFDDIDDVAPK